MTLRARAKASSPDLGAPFTVEWLSDLPPAARDDVERAVAEKLPVVLRAARWTRDLAKREGADTEAKVWLETGALPACVTVHYEPRLAKHYLLVMDAQARERLAVIVTPRVPCVTAAEAAAESRLFFETLAGVMQGRERMDAMDAIEAVQARYRAM